MALELPPGFEEASADMKLEVLRSHRSEELVEEIASHLDYGRSHSSPQLSKTEKAMILIELMD